MKKLGIIGTGGFSLEVLDIAKELFRDSRKSIDELVYFIDNNKKKHLGLIVVKECDIEYSSSKFIVAISDPETRFKVVNNLSRSAEYTNLVHPSSFISDSAKIGYGNIISHNSIVSSNVIINNHCHLNYHTAIGHESLIDDFFTASPGVKVSGKCSISKKVFMGTNSCIMERVKIIEGVKIGIGAVVLKNITKKGTYLFNPAKRIF